MIKQQTKPSALALSKFEEDFAKSFGDGTLKGGNQFVPYEVISTGSVLLDVATGVGGYVEGRIHEIWGADDLGKSTLAFMAVAEAQRKYPNKKVAYIDPENKVDIPWAIAHGVDVDKWYLYTPSNAEDVADAVGRFAKQPFISMIVVDSIGAMIGKVEQDKQADEATVAIVAKIVTRMVKNAASLASQNGQVVILINQIRSNISPYGGPTVLPGGWALKYSSTMRFKLRGTSKQPLEDVIKGEKIPVAKEIAIEIERNKVAPKGATAMVLMSTVASKYGPIGIDKADEATGVGVKLGIIHQAGPYYTLPKGQKFQGRDAVVEYLRKNPCEIEDIRKLCLAQGADVVIVDTPDDQGEVTVDLIDQSTGRAPRRKSE